MSRDLEFDRFGDFSFIGSDISAIDHNLDIVYQNVVDRLITNFGDYFLYPGTGANLSSFIGKRNNKELEDKVKASIVRSLTSERFLPSSMITVASQRSRHSMFIKISIGDSFDSVSEKIVINSIFNTSSGLLYVEN